MALPPLIPIADFFADPVFSHATISPDGTRLAYLAEAHGRLNVFVRGIDQEHADAVCVTHDERRGINLFFFTDDPRWLVYRQDADGNEEWHFYRVDLENPDAPAVDLTPLPAGGRALGAGPMQSKPGTLLAAMNLRPTFFDAFLIDVATGETTLLREQDDAGGSYIGWDGGTEFYMSPTEDGRQIRFFAVDQATGEKTLIYTGGGPEHPVGIYPSIPTADGEALLLGTYPGDSDESALLRLDRSGELSVLAAVPGSNLDTNGMFTDDFGLPPSLLFNPKGQVIAARFVGDRAVVLPLDPHFAEVFAELSQLSDGMLDSVSSDDSEQLWVATFLSDTEPGLTYLYDHRTKQSRLLFRPYPQLDPAHLAPMTSVHLTARDGLPLHAFLTLPVGVEPTALPMVLMVHGGPWAHDYWTYNRDVQFLANRGYAVLQVNFRGSTGYGKKHITCAVGELAGTMHDDLIDACDWAVKEGFADPARLGIYGGSYGGYATLVGVTFTPDYFAAGVDYVGLSSLVTFLDGLPPFVRPHLQNSWLLYAGDPDVPEQRADMIARSPITHIDKVTTPLLVIQGAKDARVVQSEADNVVNSLRARGVEVEYFVAENEGHDFKNPENLVTMFNLIEKHLGTHLGGRTA